jgi:hypothetical protein
MNNSLLIISRVDMLPIVVYFERVRDVALRSSIQSSHAKLIVHSEFFSSASCSALPPFGWVEILAIALKWVREMCKPCEVYCSVKDLFQNIVE